MVCDDHYDHYYYYYFCDHHHQSSCIENFNNVFTDSAVIESIKSISDYLKFKNI